MFAKFVIEKCPMPPSINECYYTSIFLEEISFKGLVYRFLKNQYNIKDLYRYVKSKITTRVHRTKKLNFFRHDFKHHFMGEANVQEILKATKKFERIEIEFFFYFPWKKIYTAEGKVKKMDVSNRIKPIEDILCELLNVDDRNVYKVAAKKEESESDDSYVDIYIKFYFPNQSDTQAA